MQSKRQLIDSLTSHISLYNSHLPISPSSSSSSQSNPNPNPRSSILKWFASLTPPQRQSHLTIVDQSFTQLLIQLQFKLKHNGHGLFIILPDIPSSNPNIPSFCFRKSHGLLTRVSLASDPEKRIRESLQLFDSKEGENFGHFGNLGTGCCGCLDSVTVSCEFVENVEAFVEIMDGVSNGEFLRGEEGVLMGSVDWVELNWLKVKGYYSVEAFVANRLELALRLAWLQVNVGKKRGVKLKEKSVCAAAGVAANVYWRKIGCVDWWMKLDDRLKKKFLRIVLGKAARLLTHDILYGRSSGVEDEFPTTCVREKPLPRYNQETVDTLKGKDFESGMTLFIPPSGKLSSIAQTFNRLLVVCEISTMLLAFDNGRFSEQALFFSSLEAVGTISDRILRRLRGLFMVVSLDYTKLELLEDLNSTKSVKKSKSKSKSKSVSAKKGKSRDVKKPIPVQISDKSSSTSDKPTKDEVHKSDIQEMDCKTENASTSVETEHGEGITNKTVQSTAKKNKRARKKHKKDGTNNQLKNIITQTDPVKVSGNPGTEIVTNGASVVDDNPVEANVSPAVMPTINNNNIIESQDVDLIAHEHVKEMETTQSLVTGKEKMEQNPVVVHDGGPMTFSGNPPNERPIAAPQLSFVHQSGFVHAVGLREDDFAVSGLDYSQYFGGGVMYWDSYDHPVASFSRPPSLSSDDSSWAWQEADMNRTVDDMVAFSSSYSTNGLTSPSATSFCSPFDPLGYVLPSEVSGKVLHSSSAMKDLSEENVLGSLASFPGDIEAKTGDLFPYPILRPIIIPNIDRSRDFKRSYEHKSPCVPPSRREEPRIKRPPSPVVLCVPPVSDSRKQRGFPTVRSGSSSPRHWGVKGWFHGEKKSLSARQLSQTLPGALLQDRLIAISQLTRDQESHPDLSIPLQSRELLDCSTRKSSLPVMHSLLNDEIDSFCKQVAGVNMTRKPYINWAVKRVTRSLQVLWPRSRTNIFGSNATGLSLPTSDVDLVVCLPPVRNLEPIKEAGILEGRNGIKETCLQHAARYLANQEWVKNDSLKIVENTAIPIIMLVVEVPCDVIVSVDQEISTHSDGGKHTDVQSIRIDISFKSSSHTGLQTTELVKQLTEQFPAATPLALVLKQFLADRSLDQSYSGGLSSYCLILLITRFLQHEHHYGRSISQNFGGLLMDFFYFFGNVFDPRQMRISVQGSGVYIDRERGYSIDPIYIDDPLFPANNVGRNCFRIHQCIKAFADAYSTLEDQLDNCDPSNGSLSVKLLPLIIPSIAPL
ncbi:putative polynucleotide adenylyltransferase [Helianthus annuus]|uniref:Polynucleotide adenylyltransferase n=1 Tax=Helianthus annuus TaxID=4232 RepID=A0A251VDR3_HELAN|nr:uncharacterized protein LOC110931042 isoform X2 [Helianthus annuus]KAF5816740.1 putative polynucleotide adenylyltransferase [Helianthus annuus]